MTYVLIIAIVGLVAALVVLALKLRSALDGERSLVKTALESGKHQLEAERELVKVVRDRDDLLVRKGEADLAAAKALRYALACEQALREHLSHEADAAIAKIQAATSIADAAAALSDLVSAPLPGEADSRPQPVATALPGPGHSSR